MDDVSEISAEGVMSESEVSCRLNMLLYRVIKKVSVHLMITIQKVTSDVQSVTHQGQGDTRLTLTPSVIPNSNYIIMVGD
jgi:hypothetical protein